jgi:hypothetical protein
VWENISMELAAYSVPGAGTRSKSAPHQITNFIKRVMQGSNCGNY